MSKPPPIHEREFLKICKNHGAMVSNLTKIGVPAHDIGEYAAHICERWFGLSLEHLLDAKQSLAGSTDRSTFSRAYYAVYNASKAVRYISKGAVSLAGDDHKDAASLPDDFPDVADWSILITQLYEHRLRADYDNWSDTATLNSLDPTEAVAKAEAFTDTVKQYLNVKYGAAL